MEIQTERIDLRTDPYAAQDPYDIRDDIPVPARGSYIPAWSADYRAVLDQPVLHHGRPLGYRVRDVLPERRWAIQPVANDGGCQLLEQRDFEDLYKQVRSKGINASGHVVPLPKVTPDWESIPRVERWVSMAPGADGRMRDLRQKTDSAAPAPRPTVLYNAQGEEWLGEESRTRPEAGTARREVSIAQERGEPETYEVPDDSEAEIVEEIVEESDEPSEDTAAAEAAAAETAPVGEAQPEVPPTRIRKMSGPGGWYGVYDITSGRMLKRIRRTADGGTEEAAPSKFTRRKQARKG
jgi:hypothetical protein